MVLLVACIDEPIDFSIPTLQENENYFEIELFTCYEYDTKIEIMGMTEKGQEKEEIVTPQKIDAAVRINNILQM